MAVIKTGWLKGIVDGVSTRLYAHTHSDLCAYGNPADGVTVTNKIDELNSDLGDKLSASGGEIKDPLRTSANAITNKCTTESTNILGGTDFTNGAALVLRGKDQAGINGNFELTANDGSKSATLVGTPDGTLNYGGKRVCQDGSDHIDLQTSQGKVQIACNSEGGNVRLTKITSDGLDPHIEIDTCLMNGSNGYARLYIGNSKNEAYTVFNFCEDGSFIDGNGINTKELSVATSNAVNTASSADAKSNSAINAVNAIAGAVSNLQVYFDDTTASSLIDLFNKKALSARSKLSSNGVFADYGGWSGHDFGLFIGQVVNRNVLGLYIVSDGLYKVWMSDGTSSCSYVKATTGNPITS